MADEINALMKRATAAQGRCPGASADFRVLYFPGDRSPWVVGFYAPDTGDNMTSGATLSSALRKWLAEYESRRWPGAAR